MTAPPRPISFSAAHVSQGLAFPRAFLLQGLALLVLLSPTCCRSRRSSPSPPKGPWRLSVRVPRAGGKARVLKVALRATYAQRARPLGKLSGDGVLYAYPRDRALGIDHTTATGPVDIVLLDSQKRVLRVGVSVPPSSSRRVSLAPRLHRYALVLPPEGSRRSGLAPGVQVSFSLPEGARARRVLTPVKILPLHRPPVRVLAELALTGPERTMGLMWRRSLPALGGMLFRFERSSRLVFWMKNTLISLDMIFINDDFRVTGVVHRARPRDERGLGVGNALSRYVLEVPAGFARRHGVARGASVSFSLP